MTLDDYLRNRRPAATARRVACFRALQSLPAGLKKWAERRIWHGSWMHLRSMAPGMHFQQTPDRGWRLKRNGQEIARALPFHQLVGKLDRPTIIVASGPSAAGYDWDSVRSRKPFVITVNGSPRFLHPLGIRSNLQVIIDSNFILSCSEAPADLEGVPLITTCRAASLIAARFPGYLSTRPFAIVERVNSWYGVPSLTKAKLLDLNASSGRPFHFPESGNHRLNVGWSHAADLGFFSGCTVAFAALQVACSLGAEDIEIIGMDLTGQQRCYQEAEGAPPTSLDSQLEKYILPSFITMHAALRDSPVTIRNASPVCPLPAELFPDRRSPGTTPGAA